MNAIKTLLENNIRTALADYRRHTYETDELDDVSDAFIERLAEDALDGKHELRELFRKSQSWDENLQAIVINGNKTHNPDFALVQKLATSILAPANLTFDLEKQALVERAIYFFSRPNDDFADDYIAAIEELAPNAYAPRKKQSRIFKALCDSLGVTDNSAGSQFQRLFAQFADELSTRKIDFKLFMSINPAHFVTMSNPKRDRRGTMLTSCHSFNSTAYEYNNGCSGYARDGVTFIVFTVADPEVAETLNNRKTSRQLFMYKPYNGLLLQSRLYNTHGGTRGEQEESKLYRDLVQRELSELEGIPNLWKTENYSGNKRASTSRQITASAAIATGISPNSTRKSASMKITLTTSRFSLSGRTDCASVAAMKFPKDFTASTATMTKAKFATNAKNVATAPQPSSTSTANTSKFAILASKTATASARIATNTIPAKQ